MTTAQPDPQPDILDHSVARHLSASAAWVVAGRAISAGSGLALTLLLVRLLAKSDVGAYLLILSVITPLSFIALAGSDRSALQTLSVSSDKARTTHIPRQASSLLHIAVFGGIAVALLVGLGVGSSLFNSYLKLGLTQTNLIQVAILVFLWAQLRFLSEVFRGLSQLRAASLVTPGIARGLLVLALCAVLVFLTGASLTSVLTLTIASGMLIMVLGFLKLPVSWHQLARLYDGELATLGSTLRNSLPFLVSDIALYLLHHSSLWIVGLILTSTDAATYGVAYQLVFVVGATLTLLSKIYAPLIGKLYSRGTHNELQYFLRSLTALAFLPASIIVVALLSFGKPIVRMLLGGDYEGVLPVLLILSIGQLANVAVGACGYVLTMCQGQRALAIVSVTALGIQLIIAAIGGYYFGVLGIAGATSVGAIIHQTLLYRTTIREVGIDPALRAASIPTALRLGRRIFRQLV